MSNNFYDNVLNGVLDTVNEVSQSISNDFKNTKPFDKEPIDDNEVQYWYERLSPDDMEYFVQKYGEDVVSEFIQERETKRKPIKGVNNGENRVY